MPTGLHSCADPVCPSQGPHSTGCLFFILHLLPSPLIGFLPVPCCGLVWPIFSFHWLHGFLYYSLFSIQLDSRKLFITYAASISLSHVLSFLLPGPCHHHSYLNHPGWGHLWPMTLILLKPLVNISVDLTWYLSRGWSCHPTKPSSPKFLSFPAFWFSM